MHGMYGSPSGMGGDQMDDPTSRMGGDKRPFVDSIDGDVARVIMPDGKVHEIPTSHLPKGTKEGEYLGGGQTDGEAMDENQGMDIRKKLSMGDDGGDINL